MPTAFVFGHLVMLLCPRAVQDSRSAFSKPLIIFLAYMIFCFVPVTGYFFYKFPGWSTVYLRPESLIPGWAGPFILSMYILGGFLGGLVAQLLIQTYKTSLAWLTFFLGLVWLGGMFGLTQHEYFHLGSYVQYHAGEATPIFQNPSFLMELNIMGAIMGLPLIGIIFYFRRH